MQMSPKFKKPLAMILLALGEMVFAVIILGLCNMAYYDSFRFLILPVLAFLLSLGYLVLMLDYIHLLTVQIENDEALRFENMAARENAPTPTHFSRSSSRDEYYDIADMLTRRPEQAQSQRQR